MGWKKEEDRWSVFNRALFLIASSSYFLVGLFLALPEVLGGPTSELIYWAFVVLVFFFMFLGGVWFLRWWNRLRRKDVVTSWYAYFQVESSVLSSILENMLKENSIDYSVTGDHIDEGRKSITRYDLIGKRGTRLSVSLYRTYRDGHATRVEVTSSRYDRSVMILRKKIDIAVYQHRTGLSVA